LRRQNVSSVYICRFSQYGLSAREALRKFGEGFGNGCYELREVGVLEFSVNSRQAIVAVWTLISLAISLTVVLSLGNPFSLGSWQLSLGIFFALTLVMVLPAYLLIALWQIVSEE
jgi:hypothetical protein